MNERNGLSRYRRLLRLPGLRPLGVASVVARLPLGMINLALLLLAQTTTGSFAAAGLTVGCFALASAVGSPVVGRSVDRCGPSPVLLVTGLAQPAALAAVVYTARDAAASLGPLLVAVSLAGLLVPPAGPVSPAAWQCLVTDPDLARAAFALDSLVLQLIFYIAGPPLMAVIATTASPTAAVFALAAIVAVGNAAVALSQPIRSTPRGQPEHRGHRALLDPLAQRSLVAVLQATTRIRVVRVR